MGSGHLTDTMRAIETAYPLLRGSIMQHEPEHKESRAANSMPGFHYGTAGFRCAADRLKSVMHRMGMLAALRSRVLGGLVTGLVVTASHNAASDNGVKLVDPDGGMLDSSWEHFAEALANATSPEGVIEALASIYLELELKQPEAMGAQEDNNVVCRVEDARVFVARDTRPSGEYLAELALFGIQALNAQATDFGIMTTPQLHHCVWTHNSTASCSERWKGETGYYEMLTEGFSDLIEARTEFSGSRTSLYWMGQKDSKSGTMFPLIVDGAFGVGSMKLVELLDRIQSRCKNFKIEIRNMPSIEYPEDLNKGCGAEHVQKLHLPPRGFCHENTKSHWCCSFDGDADRLVYHFFGPDGQWHLLDGDRIAVLLASFIGEELAQLPLGISNKGITGRPSPDSVQIRTQCLSVCVVQTAYANGASTAYLKEKGLKVELAKTGVKYLHPKAAIHDVGAYFEANGHGTVLFKENFQRMLSEAMAELRHKGCAENNSWDRKSHARKEIAVRRLAAFCKLANQAVGDALSDLLLVEAVLWLRGWDVEDWLSMYNDLPSCQAKLVVKDRTALRCAGEGECDETRLAEPPSLQAEIDAAVVALGSDLQPRCFVRASGTEDLVRVYAEAATQALRVPPLTKPTFLAPSNLHLPSIHSSSISPTGLRIKMWLIFQVAADGLALDALQAVHKHTGGVGPPPVAIR